MIVGDKELCLRRREARFGEIAGAVTKHNLENLATRRSAIPALAKSQQFRVTGCAGAKRGEAPWARPKEMGGKKRRQWRTGVRRGERKPGEGILKA